MAQDPTPQQPLGPAESAAPKTEAPAAPAVTQAAATPAVESPPAAPVAVPDTGYTPSGVPTFDGVREKIENRYGTALGATELAEDTPEGKSAAQQLDARQKAAEEKLEEIRASMRKKD